MSTPNTIPVDLDRIVKPLRSILFALLPDLVYFLQHEYRVISASPGPPVTMDLKIADPTSVMPDLSQVTLWPGPSGGVCVPAPGTLVLVRFNNGDPSKPAVVGTDPSQIPLQETTDASLATHLAPTSPLVDIGKLATSVAIGPMPLHLATAPSVVTAFTAIPTSTALDATAWSTLATFISAVGTAIGVTYPPIGTAAGPAAAAATAAGSGATALGTAISAQLATIPTTVVTGT